VPDKADEIHELRMVRDLDEDFLKLKRQLAELTTAVNLMQRKFIDYCKMFIKQNYSIQSLAKIVKQLERNYKVRNTTVKDIAIE
jgi:hypothetical protein